MEQLLQFAGFALSLLVAILAAGLLLVRASLSLD